MEVTYVIMRKYTDAYFQELHDAEIISVYWTKDYSEATHISDIKAAKELAEITRGDIYKVEHKLTPFKRPARV